MVDPLVLETSSIMECEFESHRLYQCPCRLTGNVTGLRIQGSEFKSRQGHCSNNGIIDQLVRSRHPEKVKCVSSNLTGATVK